MTKMMTLLVAVLACLLFAPVAEARTHKTVKSHGHARVAHSGGGASSERDCLTRETRNLLGRIESRFGRVQLISTCRPGARIATTGKVSKHASGQAIDFNPPSGKKQELVRWLIANHKSGGTMTYRDMSHIHVDIGYHFVSLGSASNG
jgi:Peptidase M15